MGTSSDTNSNSRSWGRKFIAGATVVAAVTGAVAAFTANVIGIRDNVLRLLGMQSTATTISIHDVDAVATPLEKNNSKRSLIVRFVVDKTGDQAITCALQYHHGINTYYNPDQGMVSFPKGSVQTEYTVMFDVNANDVGRTAEVRLGCPNIFTSWIKVELQGQ